jgi:uncharacterized SAM-binding protein YcdF (DUF218 family)
MMHDAPGSAVGRWRLPPSARGVRGVAAIVALGLASLPLEPRLVTGLASALEARVPRTDLSRTAGIDGIVVLGGRTTRVAAALDLARRFPHAKIVLSGPGSGEIVLAQKHLKDSDRLFIDRRPRNTHQNALFSRELMGTGKDPSWVLVTSALHMPRALGAFQAARFPVLPWPVMDAPQSGRDLSDRVWHEILGLAGYWVLGRSAALYPSVGHGQLAQATAATATAEALASRLR